MKPGDYRNNTIDAFGDAYEYLMAMYASNAGKSGGEYYTPQEVSELLTRITLVGKTEVIKIYDPACGSGSLLLKFAKILGKENVRLGFFGQEINITTYNLCRINMFFHDIDYDRFDIGHGDTLTDTLHWDDEPFEAIVSNPPYSIKWEGDANPLLINDPRFSPAGVLAPKSKADLAFIMHSLSWLAASGTAAIVCFPGVMYRGGAEQKIRAYLVDGVRPHACQCGLFGYPAAECSCSYGQLQRFGWAQLSCNAEMGPQQVTEYCQTDAAGRDLQRRVFSRLQLIGHAYDRILKVACTIADLDEEQ
ncbi:MAG: Type I restriction enzyme EcoKI M protein [Syntrophomonadaceae bacterium]|nr:Type I restriction enzyme EcoKI M protein [Bacillota bacterium]